MAITIDHALIDVDELTAEQLAIMLSQITDKLGADLLLVKRIDPNDEEREEELGMTYDQVAAGLEALVKIYLELTEGERNSIPDGTPFTAFENLVLELDEYSLQGENQVNPRRWQGQSLKTRQFVED